MEWFAANNHFISKSVSMVFIPAFIGMAGSLWSAWKTASFALWGSSAFCLLIVVVLTIGYFVPTNNAFASGGFSIELVSGNLNQWLLLHKARILLAVLSAVFGILAIATH